MTTASAEEIRAELGASNARVEARHELWRRGHLHYLLHQGQRELREAFMRSPHRRYVVNCARRFGKSFAACVLAIESALSIPRAQVRYAAPTAKQVRTIIAPHLIDILDQAPSELRPAAIAHEGIWRFSNGSEIHVAGVDSGNADRLRGVATHLAIVDEARDVADLRYLIQSVLTPQLLTVDGRMLVISTPPAVPDHALADYITEAQARGAYMHRTIYDAPHIRPERIAEFLADYTGAEDPAWRREYLAEIIVDPTRVVLPELSEHETVVVQEYERPRYFLPHIVGDLGYEDWTVIAFGYYDFVADIDVVERELVLQRTRSDVIDAEAQRVAKELWGERKVHRRKIDAPPIVRADMSKGHVRDGEALEYWAATRTDDLRAAANAMRVRISRGRVRIHPSCTTILAHAKYARWNRQRSGLDRPADSDHHYDGCAALLYFGRDLDRTTNPFPALPEGTALDTHHIGHVASMPKDTQTIRSIVRPRRRR